MSSIPNRHPSSIPSDGLSAGRGGDSRARVTRLKWAALQDAAEAVGILTGREAGRPADEIRDFPEFLHSTSNWRFDLAAHAIDDLAAVMEQGLAALLSVRARGANARAAAWALWREFETATAAIAALASPLQETADGNPGGEIASQETA